MENKTPTVAASLMGVTNSVTPPFFSFRIGVGGIGRAIEGTGE